MRQLARNVRLSHVSLAIFFETNLGNSIDRTFDLALKLGLDVELSAMKSAKIKLNKNQLPTSGVAFRGPDADRSCGDLWSTMYTEQLGTVSPDHPDRKPSA